MTSCKSVDLYGLPTRFRMKTHLNKQHIPSQRLGESQRDHSMQAQRGSESAASEALCGAGCQSGTTLLTLRPYLAGMQCLDCEQRPLKICQQMSWTDRPALLTPLHRLELNSAAASCYSVFYSLAHKSQDFIYGGGDIDGLWHMLEDVWSPWGRSMQTCTMLNHFDRIMRWYYLFYKCTTAMKKMFKSPKASWP